MYRALSEEYNQLVYILNILFKTLAITRAVEDIFLCYFIFLMDPPLLINIFH